MSIDELYQSVVDVIGDNKCSACTDQELQLLEEMAIKVNNAIVVKKATAISQGRTSPQRTCALNFIEAFESGTIEEIIAAKEALKSVVKKS